MGAHSKSPAAGDPRGPARAATRERCLTARLNRRVHVLRARAQREIQRAQHDFALCLNSFRFALKALAALETIEKDLAVTLNHFLSGFYQSAKMKNEKNVLLLNSRNHTTVNALRDISVVCTSIVAVDLAEQRALNVTDSSYSFNSIYPDHKTLLKSLATNKATIVSKRSRILLVIKHLRSWAVSLLTQNILARQHLAQLNHGISMASLSGG